MGAIWQKSLSEIHWPLVNSFIFSGSSNGYLKGEVNYKQIAERVFLLTDARKTMKALDMKLPDDKTGGYPRFTIMGRVFDPEKAEAYAGSFAIKRS